MASPPPARPAHVPGVVGAHTRMWGVSARCWQSEAERNGAGDLSPREEEKGEAEGLSLPQRTHPPCAHLKESGCCAPRWSHRR